MLDQNVLDMIGNETVDLSSLVATKEEAKEAMTQIIDVIRDNEDIDYVDLVINAAAGLDLVIFVLGSPFRHTSAKVEISKMDGSGPIEEEEYGLNSLGLKDFSNNLIDLYFRSNKDQ